MPSLVTPARRRRQFRDDADSDVESLAHEPARTPDADTEERASKRARSGSPETGRYQDTKTARAVNSETILNGRNDASKSGSASAAYQPGAIVRVKLSNFVTYKAAEFFPGPSLNMVIGPNGTGKSTLVCAICIGLGWDPKYLGRQKEISEFVKHGEAEGFIEIELFRQPQQNRNPIIKCQVKRDANKTVYSVNGRASNKKQVQELARSFSIQIDNLCQFLPQDKVVEFAAMSPIDLLHSTQQAVGTQQMIEWHKQLMEWRQSQRKVEVEAASGQETLKNLEARQKAQEADVARVREREEVKRSVDLWKTVLPVVSYYDLYQRRTEHKNKLNEAKQQLSSLQESLEPALRAVNAKEAYRDAVSAAKSIRTTALDAADADCVRKARAFDELEHQSGQLEKEIERTRKEIKDDRIELKRLNEGLKNIETQMRNEPPELDLGQLNEQIRAKERRQIEIREDDGPSARREWERVKGEAGNVMTKIASRQRDIENLTSQAGKQESKLRQVSQETAQAWRYAREHQHLFEKPIFGPPMVECSVKDQRYVPLMEALFQRSDVLYLVAQTKSDFLKLHALVKEELKLAEVNIRTSLGNLEKFPRPQVSSVDMHRWGLEGWAIEYMDGPDPVLAALCETNFLHRTAVALRDTTPEQYEEIVAGGNIQNWVTSKSYYRLIRRREYGPSATSTTVKDVRPARIWTDQPIDPEARVEMEREIAQWKEELESFKDTGRSLQDQLNTLKEESNKLQTEGDDLKREKDEYQKIRSAFRALPTRLANQRSKIVDRERHNEERRIASRELLKRRNDGVLKRAEAAIAYTHTTEELLKAHQALQEVELVLIEASSDYETLIARNEDVQNTLNVQRREVETLKTQFSEVVAKCDAARKKMEALIPQLSDEEKSFVGEHGRSKTKAEVEANIASEEARLELMHGGSGRVLVEFEERAKRIEALSRKHGAYEAALADLNTNITRVRAKWEPKLDALIRRISDAFAFNMQKIHCAGEVVVHKDPEFDQWAIQIRVKFRENEPLSQLDAHRQSGGERAVSTVFYLMSLQALTRSPFRVVDEINQGMDPRNERLVHSRMVAIATGNDEWEQHYRENLAGSASWQQDAVPPDQDAQHPSARHGAENSSHEAKLALQADGDPFPDGPADARHPPQGGSQYFLITPKLLHGLRYDEGMTVLCIASGEHMAGTTAVDFGKALALRRQSGGGQRSIAAALG